MGCPACSSGWTRSPRLTQRLCPVRTLQHPCRSHGATTSACRCCPATACLPGWRWAPTRGGPHDLTRWGTAPPEQHRQPSTGTRALSSTHSYLRDIRSPLRAHQVARTETSELSRTPEFACSSFVLRLPQPLANSAGEQPLLRVDLYAAPAAAGGGGAGGSSFVMCTRLGRRPGNPWIWRAGQCHWRLTHSAP